MTDDTETDDTETDDTDANPSWQRMSPERREAILAGVQAMRVHRDGLERAFIIGRAFHELQLEAMTRSNSNKPSGRRYSDSYAALEKPVPDLATTTKKARNQFIWCYQNKEPLEAWWALSENGTRRDNWNHPDAIKRNFTVYEKALAGETGAEKKPSWKEKMTAVVVELQEQLDKANRENTKLRTEHVIPGEASDELQKQLKWVTGERDEAKTRIEELTWELEAAETRARQAGAATITATDFSKIKKALDPQASNQELAEASELVDAYFVVIDDV